MKKICVIGMGYVGLPLAVEFGAIRPVLGFDIDKKRLSELRKGFDRTREVSSQKLAKADSLSFTDDKKLIAGHDIFIVTVPTPIDNYKNPNLTPLKDATRIIGSAIHKGAIIIFESTVYPGCTEEICVPLLEKYSGLKFNKDFYCGYSPERANPGDLNNTLINIKKITSGSNEKVAQEIDELYTSIIKAGTWKTSSIKIAEAAKVIENSQRDLNIAFVNELSVIFERMNIDTIEVLEAAGTKWNFLPFRPGIVGGHCIGVDPYYLTHKAQETGYNPQVILAGRRINDNMARYIARNVIRIMIKNKIDVSNSKVGIMGFTFKEDCPDIRNTKVIDLILEFEKWGIDVIVNDPLADVDTVNKEFGVKIKKLSEFQNIDSLVVAVAHSEYKKISPNILRSYCKSKNPLLADVKAIYSRVEAANAGFTLFRL